MHEFSMMENILRIALIEARNYSAKRILVINLVVGELTFLNIDQLRFAFEILSEGTLAEEAELNIETMAARIKCSRCGYDGPILYEGPEDHLGYVVAFLKCRICENRDLDLVSGKECVIKSLKVKVSSK
jgi:hydrogenase nickel incorporation protein HypA/HybF